MSKRAIRFFLSLVFALMWLPVSLQAQRQSAKEAEVPELRVYHLQYGDVRAAMDVIKVATAGETALRLDVDPRTNSMILLGTNKQHEFLSRLLKRIEGDNHVQVIMAPAKENLKNLAGMLGVKMAFYPKAKVIVMRGQKTDVDIAVWALKTLDKAINDEAIKEVSRTNISKPHSLRTEQGRKPQHSDDSDRLAD